MRTFSRWTVLSCGAAVALSLTGCANVSGKSTNAPAAVKTLKPDVAKLVKTDVGEYLVKPTGKPAKDVQATIDQLKTMPGVQSATLNKDGLVDLVFAGESTSKQREAAVKQLAALGDVQEGI